MYVFANSTANGGNFFLPDHTINSNFLRYDDVDWAGRPMLDAENQMYMSQIGKNDVVFNFLASKGIQYNSVVLTENINSYQPYTDTQMNNIVNIVKSDIEKGIVVSLNICDKKPSAILGDIELISTNPDSYASDSTSRYDGGGHAVFITDVGIDCFYVSSYGREYKIMFSDLQNGRFSIMRNSIK